MSTFPVGFLSIPLYRALLCIGFVVVGAVLLFRAASAQVYVGATAVNASKTGLGITLYFVFSGDGAGSLSFALENDIVGKPLACDSGDLACQHVFLPGDQLTVTAIPAFGSHFGGFAGGCSLEESQNCSLTVSESITLTATFSLTHYPINITRSGEGSGSISVTMPEGSCATRAPCVITTTYGSTLVVRAAAHPDTGSRFAGWSGDCSGSEAICSVVVTGTMTIDGAFVRTPWTLSVTTSGGGFVTSAPEGIECSAESSSGCLAGFLHGTMVELVATPADGWVFSGWTAFCSGKGRCRVPMTRFRAVQAIFEEEGARDPEPEIKSYLPTILN